MIGRKVSHYRVLEKLGEGGMGVVYKAEDTRLERTVALKFLPPEALAREEDKNRFFQEARAAAALDHPNICTVYEINDDDNETFISMAYVEGSVLKKRIDVGPLKVEAALDFSIQLAEGLRAAHEKGIVHRDIKSANIMVTERDQVKIMDFGVAKLIRPGRQPKERSTMGTVAYMSPEQTRADPVDQRTDVWSLGVVMYEMLAGKRPFCGDYEQSVIYAIVNEDPEALTAIRTGVPMEFERIVMKALAKREKNRYQGMDALLDDLRALKAQLDSKELMSRTGIGAIRQSRSARTIAIPTVILSFFVLILVGTYLKSGQKEAEGAQIPIAVADFVNETNDKDLDGLSGMLITALEQSRKLSVYTRSSLFDVLEQMGRDEVQRIDEQIGRQICVEANINVLLVASIRKFDDLYTIDLKAFEMGRPEHLFVAKEEGTGRASIPGMIDRLAERTRKGLREKSAEIRLANEKIADVTTPNVEAYQQYFLGDQFIDDLKFKEAQDAFNRAIDLDSTFALAYYRLAYASWWSGENEDIQRAQLQKALTLVHRLPEKYRFLLRAQVAVNAETYDSGIEVLNEAIEIYPDDKEITYNLGDFSFHAQHYDKAEAYLMKVLEMDPTSERALNHLTRTYSAMADRTKAVEIGERYAKQSKTDYAYRTLSTAYMVSGDLDRALKMAEDARLLSPHSPMVRQQIAMVRCMKDDFATARSILDSIVVSSENPEVLATGYGSLIGADLYMGKYRDALTHTDKIIELAIDRGDTVEAVARYQVKGIIRAWGWGDIAGAEAEFQKARALVEMIDFEKLGSRARNGYWSRQITFNLLSDEPEKARALAERELIDDPIPYERAMFFVHSKGKDYEGAHETSDSLLAKVEAGQRTMILYYLAKNQLEHGRYDQAMASIRVLQNEFHYSGPRPYFYAPSYFLLGQSQERKGDTRGAIESYRQFLEFWREADEDLALLKEAKLRLSTLQETSTQ